MPTQKPRGHTNRPNPNRSQNKAPSAPRSTAAISFRPGRGTLGPLPRHLRAVIFRRIPQRRLRTSSNSMKTPPSVPGPPSFPRSTLITLEPIQGWRAKERERERAKDRASRRMHVSMIRLCTCVGAVVYVCAVCESVCMQWSSECALTRVCWCACCMSVHTYTYTARALSLLVYKHSCARYGCWTQNQ